MMICLAACFALLCLVQGLNAEPLVQKHDIQKRSACALTQCNNLLVRLNVCLDLQVVLPTLPICVNVTAIINLIALLCAQIKAFLLSIGVQVTLVADVFLFCGNSCSLGYLVGLLNLLVSVDLTVAQCGSAALAEILTGCSSLYGLLGLLGLLLG